MKKRLLFAMMAMSVSASSFALSQGEYVYTPQGRFQITGDNLNANSSFQDLTGWTLISASADKTLADVFNINANGYAEGTNSVQSLDATTSEGMYYTFSPSSASDSYVISLKIKGTAQTTIRTNNECWDGTGKLVAGSFLANLVKISGNSANTYGATDDQVIVNGGEELTDQWQTFNYAIVGDGTNRTYYIELKGITTDIEIADLQIAPAVQFADLRLRDAMLDKINAYKNCYEWSEDLLAEYAVTEAIEGLEGIGDESGVADLEEQLTTAQEILTEFLNANMDDYLAGEEANYLGIKSTSGNTQKVSNLGIWNCMPDKRGFWSSGAYPDMGHYQQSATWCGGSPTSPMGVYTQKELDPGSYVFAIEGLGAFRESFKQTWNIDAGMNPAYGVACVAKVVDGAVTDTVAVVIKDMDAVDYTPFFVTAKIEEAGTYEFSFKGYCKEAYQTLARGSVVYVKDASIMGKNDNKYNQKQLNYEIDVREQINTGRTQLTTAAESIANADFLWGKAELQACVDTVETKIAAFEALSQDDIIATYEDYYVKSTSDAENGLMVYEVYQQATKDIIAANRKFTAVNDTLNSVQTAIDAAEATLGLRIYSAATGKDALLSAIAAAKDVQTQMKAADYSLENAETIKSANATLAEAVEAFKASVPASAIATLVDIDFENDAVLNEETQLYSVTGAAGSMEFSYFNPQGPADDKDSPYQQGHWSNGEQLYKGYIRVGNGTGTVNFDATSGTGTMGTDILKVSCDFYLQGLSGRSVGFYLKDESGENTKGFYANFYDNTIGQNDFNIALGSLKYGSGGSYNDASPEGAEGATTTTCAKNSFEVIFDFGEGSMYCTTTSAKGIVSTEKVAFDGVIPTQFQLSCNYSNFPARRVWFDNLKIERISAGATEPFVPDAIQSVKVAEADGAVYNLNGMRVANPTKGLYIVNGKKVVIK